jgi:hypothetical protein
MKHLNQVETLVSKLFSGSWIDLHSKDPFARPELKYPGVYLVAYTSKNLTGRKATPSDVFYVGMSNSAGGLRQRLKQFKKGIEVNGLHSAAMYFFRRYCGSRPFSEAQTGKRLFFTALAIPCVSKKSEAKPDDLREMGHVACLEYYALAHVAAKTTKNPALNQLGRMPLTAAENP